MEEILPCLGAANATKGILSKRYWDQKMHLALTFHPGGSFWTANLLLDFQLLFKITPFPAIKTNPCFQAEASLTLVCVT